ncbi:hypothetical protein LZ30DRAFT_726715 [Colletotrichum cereale]|nr:hypothetical protein LZ30DRAFT_726715 [Colletotrichum cereale]
MADSRLYTGVFAFLLLIIVMSSGSLVPLATFLEGYIYVYLLPVAACILAPIRAANHPIPSQQQTGSEQYALKALEVFTFRRQFAVHSG